MLPFVDIDIVAWSNNIVWLLKRYYSRQLVETRQGTKAITQIIQQAFLETTVVFSKEGNLLEHEVLLSCLMKCQNKREEVTQITYLGKEIDMIVHDDYTIDMYEVKRSSGKSEEQYKRLVDKEFNDYIEAMWGGRIRNRIVLYLGEDDSVKVNGMEIRYQNMNQFLKA